MSWKERKNYQSLCESSVSNTTCIALSLFHAFSIEIYAISGYNAYIEDKEGFAVAYWDRSFVDCKIG